MRTRTVQISGMALSRVKCRDERLVALGQLFTNPHHDTACPGWRESHGHNRLRVERPIRRQLVGQYFRKYNVLDRLPIPRVGWPRQLIKNKLAIPLNICLWVEMLFNEPKRVTELVQYWAPVRKP